ncbi:MAG: DUF1573 domain-containing protein [Thermonemataceae bacterium]
MKHIAGFISILLLSSTLLQAQGKFQFEKEVHDFGTIEEGTIAKYEFAFKNTGNQPIIVERVSASCGCTTPFYTKDPIQPGESGKIVASFNSNKRPNSFNKSITIKSNATEPMKILYIKGFVNPKHQPTQANGQGAAALSLDKTFQSLGEMQYGQTAIARFTVTNTGSGNLILTGINSDCKCVTSNIPKANLAPRESTVIELKYTPKSAGTRKDVIYLYSNDGKSGATKLYLQAEVSNDNMLKENTSANPFGF